MLKKRDVTKMSKVKRVKVRGHKRPGSKVKVTINVKEKAGGLIPMSSCFILVGFTSVKVIQLVICLL